MPSDHAVVHVIDDDEAVRQSLAFLLGTAGIEVQTYDFKRPERVGKEHAHQICPIRRVRTATCFAVRMTML